jgi:hypothetical protein
MANLLETIRQNTNLLQKPAGVTGETEKLSTLLRAKQGKAGTEPEVAQSNIAEQQAVASTNAQLQNQVAPQLALQTAQVDQAARGMEQQRGIQEQEISQARRSEDLQNRIKTDELLRNAEQARGSLDFERDRATAEQLSHNLRLQNQQYIDNLQREGAKARLNDGLRFKEELTKSAMADNEALARDTRMQEAILKDNDRSFNKKLSQMGVDQAWANMRAEIRDAKSQAMWSAIGGATQAGIQGAGAYQDAQDKKEYREYAKQNAGKPKDDFATWKASKE